MAPSPSTVENVLDYYEFLSISADATASQISSACRKTSLKYHPDKVKPTPETSAKLLLIEVAKGVLLDPTERAKYDQKREAKLRRKEENDALEGRRRQMKDDLEKREAASVTATVNGNKRPWSEQDLEIQRIRQDTQRRREAMMQAKAKARADADILPEKPTTELERSVKVRWVKEGDGFDMNTGVLRTMHERYGEVKDIYILPEKRRRRIDGKKVALGIAVIEFSKMSSADKAVDSVLDGIQSIAWAAEKEKPG